MKNHWVVKKHWLVRLYRGLYYPVISGLQIATSHYKDYPPGTITYPIPEKSLLSRWSSGFPQMGYGFVPWRVSWIPIFWRIVVSLQALKFCQAKSSSKNISPVTYFRGVKNWFVRKILEPPFFFWETQGINWVKLHASRSRQVQPTEGAVARGGFLPMDVLRRLFSFGCIRLEFLTLGLMINNYLVNGFNPSEKYYIVKMNIFPK